MRDLRTEETEHGEVWWHVAVAVGVLLLARLLAANFGGFSEGDEISIAAGVASLRNGNTIDLYRYAPQVGYYRLVWGLSALAGEDLLRIPNVMITLSAIAGTAIPIAGLLAFRDTLSRTERRLFFVALAANPILWHSSRYGNSGMMSVALVCVAAAILSNRPRPRYEALGLLLFGLAILVRADAVLATGGIGVLLWRNHARFTPAAWRVGILGLAVAATFATFLALDPRMSALVTDVGSHLGNVFETRFWDYLLWAMSPIPLLLAAVGLREMEPTRRWLLAILAAWMVPPLLFYFGAVTSPRYFLLVTFPLAVAAAVGTGTLLRLGGGVRPVVVGTTLVLAHLHLVVGLGFFVPSNRRSMLVEATFPTHDGPMWAGALLYKSYVMRRPWDAPLWRPAFRTGGAGETALASIFRELAGGERRGARVIVMTDGAFGNTMHFYAQAAGVRATACARGGVLYNQECTMELGGTRIVTLGTPQLRDVPSQRIPAEAGDLLWLVQRDSTRMEILAERLPAGLMLREDPSVPAAARLWRFRVERAS